MLKQSLSNSWKSLSFKQLGSIRLQNSSKQLQPGKRKTIFQICIFSSISWGVSPVTTRNIPFLAGNPKKTFICDWHPGSWIPPIHINFPGSTSNPSLFAKELSPRQLPSIAKPILSKPAPSPKIKPRYRDLKSKQNDYCCLLSLHVVACFFCPLFFVSWFIIVVVSYLMSWLYFCPNLLPKAIDIIFCLKPWTSQRPGTSWPR